MGVGFGEGPKLMKNLFQPEALQEITSRINQLRPESERKWGSMDVAQMLAHCGQAMQTSVGSAKPKRMLISYLVGPFLRKLTVNPKRFQKNLPTDPTFLIKDARDFETEKARLLKLIDQFISNGPANVPAHPHPLFGKLNSEEWGGLTYKHLDHHLRQFGV